MKQIHFATTNPGKIKTLEDAFEGTDVKVISENLDIDEIRSEDINEIATHKVRDAYKMINKPVIAQDGGFFIDALNGFPGSYVHSAMNTIGTEGILKMLEGKERSAHFIDILCYYDGKDDVICFDAVVKGTIAEEERGSLTGRNWGKPHLIFIPEGLDKTLAELSEDEMKEWFEKQLATFCTTEFAKWFIKNKA